MKYTRTRFDSSFAMATCLLLVAAMLLGSCSRRTQMPRHRKYRHCDCPTFSMDANDEPTHGLYRYQSL
ncbi:MAG: hypothetical protein SPJ13_01035 [Bacteroidales bacterium]|nr:hypothetical protein [Bacteroidales bacterium]